MNDHTITIKLKDDVLEKLAPFAPEIYAARINELEAKLAAAPALNAAEQKVVEAAIAEKLAWRAYLDAPIMDASKERRTVLRCGDDLTAAVDALLALRAAGGQEVAK